MSTHEYADDASQFSFDSTRPHSIDLTIALEHQLAIDSLPNSPIVARSGQDHTSLLDPQVVESIVTQLRSSLEAVTKERDELSTVLAEVQARETDLKAALHTVSERCMHLETEHAAVLEKSKEDQDAVNMLRGKLEDSRRALMRLQTENRRSSMAIDLSRAGPSSLSGPSSSRRSSFVPLSGSPGGRTNAHRRISSVSEPGASYGDGAQWGSPPNTARLEPLQLLGAPASTPPAQTSRRLSGFFGRTTPTPPELPPMVDASEVEELKKELQAVKEQLEETRHELTETRESQEASETCANALRTFIADNSIGMHPPGRDVQSAPPVNDASRGSVSTRWGFKLWNSSTASTPATSPCIQNVAAPTAITAAPPLTRKLGGFFSSRSSISSTTSSAVRADLHQQEPMCNGSDASSVESVTEPVSPASDVPSANILVQTFDGAQAELMDSPEQTKRALETVDSDHQLDSHSVC